MSINLSNDDAQKLKAALDEYEFRKMQKEFRDYMAKMASQNVFTGGFSMSISPTDKNSAGKFEYQEPEQDEQGTLYGYKVLQIRKYSRQLIEESPHIKIETVVEFHSPRYTAKWIDGELEADFEPAENTMYGIHCTKRADHPELSKYHLLGYGNSVLVKCALSGTVIETEQGFRAQHAQIVGLYTNGNWQSYQDYTERTQSNSGHYSEEEKYKRDYLNPYSLP